MAPDWAEALAPVDDRIGRMGQFLREELAAGRAVPAGRRPRLPRLPAAAGRRPGARRRPGPLPDARATRSGCSFAVDAARPAAPARAWPTSTRSCAPTSASMPPRHGDLTALGRPGRDAAQPGAHRAARRSRPRTAAAAGRRSPSARSPRWSSAAARASRSSGAATPRRSSRCSARSRGSSRRTRRRCRRSRGFFGSRPFTRVNRLLDEQGGAAGGLVAPDGIKLNLEPLGST